MNGSVDKDTLRTKPHHLEQPISLSQGSEMCGPRTALKYDNRCIAILYTSYLIIIRLSYFPSI